MRLAAPVALLLIPVLYIILISMVTYLHNKEQSSFGDTVIEVLRIASTLWPITFAAVLGPFLKTIALLKAERGTTLASLEFLLTSQTTATALLNLLTLRRIKEVSALVIAGVWLLGPLGGQAALRSIHIQQKLETTQTRAFHYLGGNESEIISYYHRGADVHTGASGRASLIAGTRSIISASFSNPDVLISHANGSSPSFDNTIGELGGILQASRLGHRDLWRNVRVPFLELLPGYDSNNPTLWVLVPLDQVVPYASLIGLPIRAESFNRAGNLTMMVQYHYQTLDCGDDFDGTSWVRNDSTSLYFHNTTSPDPLKKQTFGRQKATSYPNIWFDIANTSTAREQLDFSRRGQQGAHSNLQLIMGGECQFEDNGRTHENVRLRLCGVYTSYIEMEVQCTRGDSDADLVCRVSRVRRAPFHPKQGNLTALSSHLMAAGILMDIPFTGATEHESKRAPSIVEAYLRDPTNTLKRDFNYPHPDLRNYQGCYSSVPPAVLERRLSMVLNTFVMASYNLTALTGGDGAVIDGSKFPWKSGTATWSEFATDIYVVDWSWLSITVISTVVLVICAVANVIIRLRIKAPDFLNSVASLTRDSPFIDISNQVGSGLSGQDSLKVLRDVQVQIRDVYLDRDVGRIALTTDLTQQKLKLDRDYE
ncbi:hypothetical protein FIE12Z_10128 [Fusarium flagelliforme]|uniref:Uncharacterized protein n=1 Tax=Fusarium flagelliforme TaxID=2675880 RepID=A0A395MCR5_9HYPO|nr:hypothetical protein FIE12Z_10128 [Fusarium flagelliforme]